MSDEFRILLPCHRERDSLDGHGAVRWCGDCNKHVYDFAKLKRDEIHRLTAAGSICGILSRDADGSVQTADRRGFLRWASAFAASSLLFAFGQKVEESGGIQSLVVDGSGAPVAKASVSAGVGFTATGDDQGRFTFRGLTPGVYPILIEASGQPSTRLDVLVTSGRVVDLGSLVMGNEPTGVTGVVVDATGAVITGAKVSLQIGGSLQPVNTVTDDQGRISIARLPAGDYKIQVESPGFIPAEFPLALGTVRMELGQIVLKVGDVTMGVLIFDTGRSNPIGSLWKRLTR